MCEVLAVMKVAQRRSVSGNRAVDEQVAGVESTTDFRRNQHISFPDCDRHFAGDECSVGTMTYEVGCCGVESPRTCNPSDVVDGGQ